MLLSLHKLFLIWHLEVYYPCTLVFYLSDVLNRSCNGSSPLSLKMKEASVEEQMLRQGLLSTLYVSRHSLLHYISIPLLLHETQDISPLLLLLLLKQPSEEVRVRGNVTHSAPWLSADVEPRFIQAEPHTLTMPALGFLLLYCIAYKSIQHTLDVHF